jgi:CheY-like chemotaxis protein
MFDKLILIVEDNEESRRLFRKVLQRVGYRTAEAISGEEALDVLGTQMADLVLLDYQLPGINGIETFRRLRAIPRLSGVRVVAVTASAMREDLAKIRKEGFDALETKPIGVRGLLKTIGRLLSKEPS